VFLSIKTLFPPAALIRAGPSLYSVPSALKRLPSGGVQGETASPPHGGPPPHPLFSVTSFLSESCVGVTFFPKPVRSRSPSRHRFRPHLRRSRGRPFCTTGSWRRHGRLYSAALPRPPTFCYQRETASPTAGTTYFSRPLLELGWRPSQSRYPPLLRGRHFPFPPPLQDSLLPQGIGN